MVIVLLSRSKALRAVFSALEQGTGNCRVIDFDNRVELIRYLSVRANADLVVIDADTDAEAIAFLATWRTCHARHDLPILVTGHYLSAAAMRDALACGGDDIVAGALSLDELQARAYRCVARRRTSELEATVIEYGGYRLDKLNCRCTREGCPIHLTTREFATAWLFFSHPGSVLSRPRISEKIWGEAAQAREPGALTRYINQIRRKLGLSGGGPVALRAVYASGYRLDGPQPARL
ncbi:Transcriptional regulatory protein KdpE [Pandoraea iniqua]|uniref:Transcriptional regulatory protein KdpE n=1 Tax=Pandoraea iniqua TaxID=2508288 RepID=A0A5E4VJE9_9BURK|nr:response regulator transcription factor [Pandoraea iniqua]VVE11090.1 Transcriptional regulatory protein KdpE [Pandoraea iniqua]VVE31727.1 Transcriptional regulatory protein KdpE [Pandoraea iniqua]